MNQRHGFTVVGDRVFNSRANQAFGAFFRTRLDADTAMFREANFFHAHFITQEFNHLVGFGAVGFPFDTGVDVFGVFTEDHHVGQFRMFNRARGALVVTNRAQAHIQIQLLAQRHVQRTDTAANRRGQRAFNGYAVVADQIEGFFRQPDVLAIKLGRFFPGVDFHPGNFTLALIGFLNSGINHFQHRGSHVNTDTVAFNKRDNRIVWHRQFAVF